VGHIPINIKVAESDKNRIVDTLQKIHPRVSTIEVTTASLNKSNWSSQLCAETDVYTRGVLQVPKNSLIILDETRMQPGTLNEVGVKNLF
jgi:hypothetical protein